MAIVDYSENNRDANYNGLTDHGDVMWAELQWVDVMLIAGRRGNLSAFPFLSLSSTKEMRRRDTLEAP